MKVAFITPELEPLVRRTQLAQFARDLPLALRAAGEDVRIFLPASQLVDIEALAPGVEERGSIKVRDLETEISFRVLEGRLGELPIYLFENSQHFANRNPYGGNEGPYPDNWRRYAAFSRAVLESLEALDFAPDVIHCLDWTTGLVPVLRQVEFSGKKPPRAAERAGILFQIFNLAVQGTFEREVLQQMRLPQRLFTGVGGLELNGKVNFLKAGCEFSGLLATHSSGHAQRIQELDRGYGLEEVFRRRSKDLLGITSGIDYQAWDPSNDAFIAQGFSTKDPSLAGKRKCKTALQGMLNLDKGPRTPIAALVGRFDTDSGVELLAESLTDILERGVELVLMGAGRPDITDRLRTMESTFPGRCRILEGYRASTAHAIMAGADILLLPSHYNPGNTLCAIGMRYGVVPVIYGSSGLEDYVTDIPPKGTAGTGFHFTPYASASLLEAVERARKLYRNAAGWKRLVLRCMGQDFSWTATAEEYLKAYKRVMRRARPPSGRQKIA